MSTNRLTVSLSVDSFGGDGSSASGSLTIASVFGVRGKRSGLLRKTRQSLHIAANDKNSMIFIHYSTQNKWAFMYNLEQTEIWTAFYRSTKLKL